jgi:hypothetical protein
MSYLRLMLIGAALAALALGYWHVTERAYERGVNDATQQARDRIERQLEDLRRDKDRIRTLPDDALDCELRRLRDTNAC